MDDILMTIDDKNLVEAFRIRMANFNIGCIIGIASYEKHILALSLIAKDGTIMHFGTSYGQLLSYDTMSTSNNDNEWFNSLCKRRSYICKNDFADQKYALLKNPDCKINIWNGTGFRVLLSKYDTDVLHIAKWISVGAKRLNCVYLHQISSIDSNKQSMWIFWRKNDSPEKIFIEMDLNVKTIFNYGQ